MEQNGSQSPMTDDFDWDALWDNPETITLSEEDFERLCAMLNEPPDPATQESLRALFNRKLPWDSPDDEKTV